MSLFKTNRKAKQDAEADAHRHNHRAAMWTSFFGDAMASLVDYEMSEGAACAATNKAAHVADFALMEYESRWMDGLGGHDDQARL